MYPSREKSQPKRKSSRQLNYLQSAFDKQPSGWSKLKVKEIAKATGLSAKQVTEWETDQRARVEDAEAMLACFEAAASDLM